MKLIKIVQAIDGLNKICNIELPAVESFKVVKLVGEIESHINNYNTQRNKLLKKYGDTEDDTTFSIRPEECEDFMKEINELGEIEIDLDFEKIKLPKDLAIKASDIVNMTDFIELKD